LNSDGTLIDSKHLDKFISFDRTNGVIACEAGVKFSDIIKVCVPKGWFLPVTPGTRFVTLGGAIANDVHGKNHHVRGTFGRHVVRLGLQRSDGTHKVCSLIENADLFRATIGGLGLTGFIVWAEIQLLPVSSDRINLWTKSFASLEEFYEISARTKNEFEYTVAWLDCSSTGKGFGRGIFLGGDHQNLQRDRNEISLELPDPKFSIPFNLPGRTLNALTVKAFNTLYYHKNKHAPTRSLVGLDKYFYPLDGIYEWNRIYGKKGFYQYQFCIPTSRKSEMKAILGLITRSGCASFLAVLKEFGDVSSPGLLSFPMPGYCLALDFPDNGTVTVQLIANIDKIVRESGGRAYPAKDRLMSSESFREFYPNFAEFKPLMDTGMSSDFWRRVMPNE
jgi:FAD/FMN-containing dehydrogenase